MKRILSLGAILALLVGLLAACGTKDSVPATAPGDDAQYVPAPDIFVPDQLDVILWVPDGSASYLVEQPATVENGPQGLVDGLIRYGALPEGVRVLSYCTEDNGTEEVKDGVAVYTLGEPEGYLNLSAEFGEAMNSTGTAGELMLMSSVVNTFLEQYHLERLTVTVEGKTLETGHAVYDQPQTKYFFLESDDSASYTAMLAEEDRAETESMAREYYDSGTPYELLTLRLAEDDRYPMYLEGTRYSAYPPGQVAVYEAETSHAGAGVYRHIIFVRDSAEGDWTQAGEGY